MPTFARMEDIRSKQDIEQLIREFYNKLLSNDAIKPVFEGLDFDNHIPRIVAFWSFVLLDEEGYTSNVFEKHLHLPIQAPHFDIWLTTFTQCVDRLFEGKKAELAKQRATLITYTFKSKWAQLGK
ncbi:MAG TPA: group III truncated hemoglobin [Bacteroidia bacterium]|nr:group III truncated hemoglobin [Bacteroidia bacterium]